MLSGSIHDYKSGILDCHLQRNVLELRNVSHLCFCQCLHQVTCSCRLKCPLNSTYSGAVCVLCAGGKLRRVIRELAPEPEFIRKLCLKKMSLKNK